MLQTTLFVPSAQESSSPSPSKSYPLESLGELGVALTNSDTYHRNPQVRRIYATRDFYATTPQQLSVFVDDRHLEVVDDCSDPNWWMVRDAATGHCGLIPADIVEEETERQARLNCNMNSRTHDPNIHAEHAAKQGSKKKRAVVINDERIKEIPASAARLGLTAAREDDRRTVAYDEKLEQSLNLVLQKSLDNRIGKLVRIYSGSSLQRHSQSTVATGIISKTIKIQEDMTIGEMALMAGLKFNQPARQTLGLCLRNIDSLVTTRLDPKWRIWQVIELAKTLQFSAPNNFSGLNATTKTRKYYRKQARKFCPEKGVGALKRREDLDFVTRFQFILEDTLV